MSHHPAEAPVELLHGDGIEITFVRQGDGTAIATIRDALRDCTISRRMFSRYVEQHPDLVRRYLDRKLIETLNKREPLQVGCFRNGNHGASSSPDSMAQRDASLSPPMEDPASDPTVRNLVNALFDAPSAQDPLIACRGEAAAK